MIKSVGEIGFEHLNLEIRTSFRISDFVLRISAAMLLGFAFSSSVAAAEIRLRSSALCAAPIVRLEDVAEVRAEDPALAEALSLIAICPAPPKGTQRTLTQHDVRQIVALTGVELAKVAVTGSEQVVLQAEAALAAHARSNRANAEIRQALYSVESPPDRPAVPSRPAPAAPLPATSATDGKAERLVERGAAVTVHSRRPGVRITASGKALQPGAGGELIGVELNDTKQRVLGRVIGPQTVEVGFNAAAIAGDALNATSSPARTSSANP